MFAWYTRRLSRGALISLQNVRISSAKNAYKVFGERTGIGKFFTILARGNATQSFFIFKYTEKSKKFKSSKVLLRILHDLFLSLSLFCSPGIHDASSSLAGGEVPFRATITGGFCDCLFPYFTVPEGFYATVSSLGKTLK